MSADSSQEARLEKLILSTKLLISLKSVKSTLSQFTKYIFAFYKFTSLRTLQFGLVAGNLISLNLQRLSC